MTLFETPPAWLIAEHVRQTSAWKNFRQYLLIHKLRKMAEHCQIEKKMLNILFSKSEIIFGIAAELGLFCVVVDKGHDSNSIR